MALTTGLVGTAPCRFAVDSSGQVYIVNGADPPMVWDGVSTSAVRNWGIAAPPAPSAGSTSGTGLTGTYYYQITWYNANTGEYGEPLALALGPFTLANQGYTVNRPSTAGIDSQITHWRLWRTTAGQASVYYLQGTYTIATGSTTDSTADTVVQAAAVLQEHYRPDGKYPFVKFYKGRFVVAGSRIESAGTVTLTNGSTAVAGSGTNFRASHVGQRLYAAGEAVYYTIASVTNATTAALTANYAGSTAAGKTFRIVPVRANDLAWSQADSESFGLLSSVGVFPADGDNITGIETVGTSLCIFKRSHVYLFDYGSNPDPLTGSGNLSMVLSSRGIVNQQCVVPVGQSAYCLDQQGVYEFDGTSQEQPIDQAIRRLFNPDDEVPTAYRINRALLASNAHGVYDQRTDTVRFFIPLSNGVQGALCWSRERRQWTIDAYDHAFYASCQGRDANGEYRAWVGDGSGWVWALAGTRQCEGNSSGTTEGTVTSSTNATLTDSGAAFLNTGNKLKGVYVKAIAPGGTVQTRLITDNTATQLTVSTNWTNNPDATYTYVVGAVESTWKSVWHFIEPNPSLQAKEITILFEPTAAGRYFKVRFYKDFQTTPILTWRNHGAKDGVTVPKTAATDGYALIDASFAKGRVRLAFPDAFTTCYAVELSMLSANEPVLIRGYDLEAVQIPAEFDR